jgi:hypothetical protein
MVENNRAAAGGETLYAPPGQLVLRIRGGHLQSGAETQSHGGFHMSQHGLAEYAVAPSRSRRWDVPHHGRVVTARVKGFRMYWSHSTYFADTPVGVVGGEVSD